MNLYRIHYINYHNLSNLYSFDGSYACGVLDWSFKPFYIDNIEQEDMFKILSYLIDYISNKKRINKYSLEIVKTLDYIMFINDIGFKKVEINNNQVKDIFIVTGITNRFNNSEYYSKYFEWYVPNISKEEFVNIYNKYNIKFNNLDKYINNKKLTLL